MTLILYGTYQRQASGTNPLFSEKRITQDFFNALQKSCAWHLAQKAPILLFTPGQYENWLTFCEAVQGIDQNQAYPLINHFFEEMCFDEAAFFTGYYEPTLKGSLTQSAAYPTPLYQIPTFKNFSRQAIDQGALKNKNLELVYVTDAVDAFFLEIQGSGRIELDNHTVMRVGYAGQNGYPFTPIGRVLKERGAIHPNHVSLQTIKEWLHNHPQEIENILHLNESYVFFKEILQGDQLSGPIGTQQLPLTPMHSLACDAAVWPFGMIIAYEVQHPVTKKRIRNLALTQDTGGAIKGKMRFDLFCGHGKDAENLAGHLKNDGVIRFLCPKKDLC